MAATPPQIRLWDDNPSTLDLLGFDAVNPDRSPLRSHERNIHPLTLSVQSPWGGGKSTILKLIEAEFKDDDTCFVVSTNPWPTTTGGRQGHADLGDSARHREPDPRSRSQGQGRREGEGAAGTHQLEPCGGCHREGSLDLSRVRVRLRWTTCAPSAHPKSAAFDVPAEVHRAFREQTGMTFSRWRYAARMRIARDLLVGGAKPSAIARRVGYGLPTFSAAFSRFHGVSPREYQERQTGRRRLKPMVRRWGGPHERPAGAVALPSARESACRFAG